MEKRVVLARRGVLRAALAALTMSMAGRERASAAPAPIGLPSDVDGWTVVSGRWAVEELAGAPSGTRALVQRAVTNEYNVIVAPSAPYADVDVSVAFLPMAGKVDASGGIVFRFTEGTYYVIRANALEDSFRLYTYDRSRRMLATAKVSAPALGRWHTLRAVVVGDHIQGWLDGALLLDHRDSRFRAGRVGLWTKADSVTAFDDLIVRGSRK